MSDEATTTGKSYLTPFNIVAGIIVIIGLFVTILRFTQGLGAVTNLSDYNPWGIWIGFDLLVGVALAAGGFVTSSAVYIFGMKKYHSAVRPAIPAPTIITEREGEEAGIWGLGDFFCRFSISSLGFQSGGFGRWRRPS